MRVKESIIRFFKEAIINKCRVLFRSI